MIQIDNTFVRMFTPDEQLIMIRLLIEADSDGVVAVNGQRLSEVVGMTLTKVYILLDKLQNDHIITKKDNSVTIADFKRYWVKPKVQRKKKEVVVSSKPLKERMHDFGMSLIPYMTDNGGKYPKEMIRAFYDYWSEPNQAHTKMRWELQKTWSVAGRLATWASKDRNYNYKTRDEQRTDEVQRRQESAAGIIARLIAEEGGDAQ